MIRTRVRMASVNKFFAVVFILLSFVTVLAQQHSADAPNVVVTAPWVTVAPDKAGFSLLLPGKPTEQVVPVASSPGVESHTFVFETPVAAYIFSYVQFSQEITDPDAIKGMLDAGREGGLASSGGKLKGETEIRLNEYYGREWRLELRGGLAATTHAYWVKRRLYQLLFIVAPTAGDTPETIKLREESANKFFDSFRLVSEVGN